MVTLHQLYLLALVATVLASIGMAWLLRLKVRKAPGLEALIFFCLGVAFWTSGHLAINFGTTDLVKIGQAIVNMSPVVPALFIHFVTEFLGYSRKKLLLLSYVIALATAVSGAILQAGVLRPWAGFESFYQFDSIAMTVAVVTAAYSIFGHLLLLSGRKGADPRKRRQIKAAFLAGAWGFVSASGFLMGSIGIEIFPYPVLLLPFYIVFLVYGLLRYELMDINILARKSVAWILIVLILLLVTSMTFAILAWAGTSGLAAIPLWQLWLFCLAIVFLTLILQRPALEAATRLVYPGSHINASILREWQKELDGVLGWRELSLKGTKILSEHLGFTVEVNASLTNSAPYSNKPAIVCEKRGTGWQFRLSGWAEATPGIIHTAEVFGTILVSSSSRLEEALKIAEREKELLKEAHLADLGRISASVAHELRNPLNIISMASARCEDGVKNEISLQLARAKKLTGDLLTYSGKMKIERKELKLGDEIDYVLSHYSKSGMAFNVDISTGLTLSAESHRIHQVLFNLIDNSTAALKGKDEALIGIFASGASSGIRIIVADNGPGIPQKIATDLFRPFISGRPGSNGLGLAISKRIMEAHGGSIEHIRLDGWSCAFELNFPKVTKDDFV